MSHIKDHNHFLSELSKAKNDLVVVAFKATWCGPCKRMAPHFEQLAHKYPEVIFLMVDIDECVETKQSQGIKSMPTFIIYRNKSEIDRLSGANIDGLMAIIERNIGRKEPGCSIASPKKVINLDSTQPNCSFRVKIPPGSRVSVKVNLPISLEKTDESRCTVPE